MTPPTTRPVPPQLSITLLNFSADDPGSWEPLLARAEAADRAGVDRVVVVDHVVFGEALDDYARPELGGQQGGRQPTGPDGHWLEPLTVLAAVAPRTTACAWPPASWWPRSGARWSSPRPWRRSTC